MNVTDISGWTPLYMAQVIRSEEIVELFKKYGFESSEVEHAKISTANKAKKMHKGSKTILPLFSHISFFPFMSFAIKQIYRIIETAKIFPNHKMHRSTMSRGLKVDVDIISKPRRSSNTIR